MNLFWDSSALLAILFKEDRSPLATEAWDQSDADYAWRWLKVEAMSGLARREANSDQWTELHQKLATMYFLDLPSEEIERICTINRNWKLRSADAGHLYCFQRTSLIIPDLQFVCFDEEMILVVQHLSLKLWQPVPPDIPPSQVRERRPSYSRKRRRVTS